MPSVSYIFNVHHQIGMHGSMHQERYDVLKHIASELEAVKIVILDKPPYDGNRPDYFYEKNDFGAVTPENATHLMISGVPENSEYRFGHPIHSIGLRERPDHTVRELTEIFKSIVTSLLHDHTKDSAVKRLQFFIVLLEAGSNFDKEFSVNVTTYPNHAIFTIFADRFKELKEAFDSAENLNLDKAGKSAMYKNVRYNSDNSPKLPVVFREDKDGNRQIKFPNGEMISYPWDPEQNRGPTTIDDFFPQQP